jgi:hypothetical protein
VTVEEGGWMDTPAQRVCREAESVLQRVCMRTR